MDTRTTIFLFLAIFYGVFFGFLGLVPEEIGTESNTSQPINDTSGFFGWVSDSSDWGSEMVDVFGNINTRVTGLHPVFQFMLWTPLSIMLIWLIVQLIVWITPFIGGGS